MLTTLTARPRGAAAHAARRAQWSRAPRPPRRTDAPARRAAAAAAGAPGQPAGRRVVAAPRGGGRAGPGPATARTGRRLRRVVGGHTAGDHPRRRRRVRPAGAVVALPDQPLGGHRAGRLHADRLARARVAGAAPPA